MKKDVLNLPDHYISQAVIDLKKNKKQALGVNLCALIIAAVMVLVAVKFVPLKSAYAGASLGMVKLGVIIAGMVACDEAQVRVILSRARNALRGILKKMMDDERAERTD